MRTRWCRCRTGRDTSSSFFRYLLERALCYTQEKQNNKRWRWSREVRKKNTQQFRTYLVRGECTWIRAAGVHLNQTTFTRLRNILQQFPLFIKEDPLFFHPCHNFIHIIIIIWNLPSFVVIVNNVVERVLCPFLLKHYIVVRFLIFFCLSLHSQLFISQHSSLICWLVHVHHYNCYCIIIWIPPKIVQLLFISQPEISYNLKLFLYSWSIWLIWQLTYICI